MRPSPSDGRLPLILFITDGEPTVGERNPDQLAALGNDRGLRASAHRRIFTFGLGSDVNVGLLEQLALEGRGTAQFVRPEESVERMVGVVANRLVDPVMTDVRVRVEGDIKLSKILPAQPADIFADRDLTLLARYSGSGRGRIIVEGTRRGSPVQFTSTVEFPDRDRQNAFVARLWASQRVGFLSAEKRRNGGEREVDEEIRMLGERYGIPTEFTSYLVVEPRLAMARAAAGAGPVPASAPPSAVADQRSLRFESAKSASAQRAASTVAAVDSIALASRRSAEMAGNAASTRVVNGHTFVLRDGVWTDVRYTTSMQTTKIKPFSKAYFDLVSQLPELRAALALGDRVIVVGRDRAISSGDDGVSELSASALAALVKAW
jgi:Ca-activated chloride channel family protein